MSTRVYVATTLADLARFHADGEIPAGAERVVADGDDEDSEWAALVTAAVLSAGLRPAGGRRVVVVAETAGDGEGALPRASWAAVHADVEDRPDGADPEDDLAWFATQEIPDLI